MGRLPSMQALKLSIALPLRNEQELDTLLQQLYDPQSPMFRRFLRVEEFTARFGATQEDYDAVIHFAEANGLRVTSTSPNRLLVNVAGTVANVERAFHVTMGVYQHPTEARTFFAADREPTVDLPFPLWHITGLDNFSIPRPAGVRRDPQANGAKTGGSAPGGYFLGSDMRAAYAYQMTQTGAGQSVGLLEFAGYNVSDVANYFKVDNKTNPTGATVPIIPISVDGSSVLCTGTCDDTEQVLDIEEAIAMAPGLDNVRVFVSDTSDAAIFNAMTTNKDGNGKLAMSLSCSWGWSPADSASTAQYFKTFAAQGQTLFVASGDNGAYQKGTKYIYPADDVNITSVGGTNLTTAGQGGPWQSETAWVYSGGGISFNGIPIPDYQATPGVITTANRGSKTLRNCPDVAMEANTDNYICYNGTCAGGWGGTSFAAPRWAGYMALVNQAAGSPLGSLNPTIYKLGLSNSYGATFHDITSGNNGKGNSGFPTAPGYDLVTGWGSPNGVNLLNYLLTH
jgi:kumamolisin